MGVQNGIYCGCNALEHICLYLGLPFAVRLQCRWCATLLALLVWSTLRASQRLSCCNLPESSSQSPVNAAKVYSGGIGFSRFAESQSVRSMTTCLVEPDFVLARSPTCEVLG